MVAITGQTLATEIFRQQKLAQEIAADQAAVSSRKKYTSPSDNPQAWVQISDLSRQQASQQAWQANLDYAKTRAQKAEANLNQINNVFSRAIELIITAGSTAEGQPSDEAIIADLRNIKATLNDLTTDTDYQGNPVFDEGEIIKVPVARTLNLEPVGTRQSVLGPVTYRLNDGSEAVGDLNQILDAAIAAVQSGDSDTRQEALGALRNGLDHIIVGQALQGVRAQRLDEAQKNLTNTDLTLKERRSTLEETDLTETLSRLQANLTTLYAAQAAFARINQNTLFDLLI